MTSTDACTVVVDCRMISSSGVGVYLRGCLPYFLASGHRFLLLGDPALLAPFAEGRQGVTVAACTVEPFSLRELFAFPRPLLRLINGADVYYSPYFNIPGGVKVPVYTTIHDIIFPDMPELCSKAGLAARMWFYRRAARRSKHIFTVSRFSKERIEYRLGRETPVTVTGTGANPHLFTSGNTVEGGADALTNATITQTTVPYVLFVGNIKRHKGLWCLLDAFLRARDALGGGCKLVILGKKDNFRSGDTETLSQLDAVDPAAVTFTGFVTDEELGALYADAALLVQPSLYEGFGLPPLEALLSGTPALLSDIPVFREIYGDYPVQFFRAGDAGDLQEKLMAFFQQPGERVVLPRELRGRHTFEKTAGVVLAAIFK